MSEMTLEQLENLRDEVLETIGSECSSGAYNMVSKAFDVAEANLTRAPVQIADEYGEPVSQKISKALGEVSNAMEDVETGKPAVAVLSFLRLAQEYLRDAHDDLESLSARLAQPVTAPDPASFACYLIDKHEKDTIYEESVQQWLADFFNDPRYAKRAEQPHPQAAQGGEEYPVIDLDAVAWEQIKEAAAQATWMPPEYMANDWHADVCEFLRSGPAEWVAVPDGHVIVPITPTDAMCIHARERMGIGSNVAHNVYMYMLEAAPTLAGKGRAG